MSQKRQSEEDPAGSGDKRWKGGAAFRFRGLVMDVMRVNKMQNLLGVLEPLLRRIVKEEVERALTTHLVGIKRQCGSHLHPSSSGSLLLHFRTTLCHPIFTGSKIEGEGGSLVVALLDSLTGNVVATGPESSSEVEIVVLEGDFEGDKEDNWVYEEFTNNIVKEREGKRPLLAGDVCLHLKEGIGVVNELSFTDNSSWTRSRKFRLGAKFKNGHVNGIRVKEAKTEPFVVRDHRGELYKKHHPPSLQDEIWRLEKIGKDGAFHKRLSREKINTVQDFLMLLSVDASRLRNILGGGMSNKMWETVVEHARKCVLPKEVYVYYEDNRQNNGIVYNIIGELKGLISEQQYTPVTDLSDVQKADALKLLKVAYKHPRQVYPHASEDSSSPSLSPIPDSSSPQVNFYDECSSSQRAGIFGSSLPSMPNSDMLSSFPIDCMRGMDDCRDPTCTSSFLQRDDYNRYSPSFDDELPLFMFEQSLPPDSPIGITNTGAEYLRPCGKLLDKKLNLTSTLDSVATKGMSIGWGPLVFVLNWRCRIKRIVASKRRGQIRI